MKHGKNPGASRAEHRGRGAKQKDEASDGLFIESWSALEEYLRAAPTQLGKIEVQPREKARLEQLLQRFGLEKPLLTNTELPLAFRAEICVNEVSEDEFFAAIAQRAGPMILMALDQISDTRNLGAIARSAAFFGVPWLIMPKDRQAWLTSGSLSAAQGAFAFVRPIRVTNLSRVLKRLKELDFWVMGTDMEGESLTAVKGSYERIVLVLGSEDRGLRPLTRKHCDRMLAIGRATTGVESLNVAVAAGIFLHQLSPGTFSQ